MKYKNEFDFVVLTLNDYIMTLPMSTRVALGEKVQQCITVIEAGLVIATDVPEKIID